MFNGLFLSRARWLILPVLTIALAACDGSGGEPDVDFGGAPSDTELAVHARATGEIIPGLTVTLSAEVEGRSAAMDYLWSQVEGPAVELANAESATSHFRVPPVTEDTTLSFKVVATDRQGNSGSYDVRVNVEALTWNRLRVKKRKVTEQFVVFLADKDIRDRLDLYLATLDGETIIRLNDPPPVPNGDVFDFRISPDRKHVAYLADQEADQVFELYAARTDGRGVSKINGPLVAGGNVARDFAWSPDSKAIAYLADQLEDNVAELFVSEPDGDNNVRVSGDLVLNGGVRFETLVWCPDGGSIAYVADQNIDQVFELFVSDADGEDNLRVSGPLVPGGQVLDDIAWSPDCEYLAYRADQLVDNDFELFTSTPDGSENTPVSIAPVIGGDVQDFAWAPDSSRIAYRGDVIFDDLVELFSVLPDGTGNTRVSAVPIDGGVGRLVIEPDDFQWAPDSSAIAYVADQFDDNVFELFVSGPDGAGNRRVSGPMVAGGDVREFAWSPDSAHLAYRADQNTINVRELFISAPDGSNNLQVSGAMVAGGFVEDDWQWSPDSQWLAYRADQNVDNVTELFTTTPSGSPNVQISGPLVPNAFLSEFRWSPDSSRIVYRANQLDIDTVELFVAAPDGSAPNDSISGEITPDGDVFDFALE